MKNIDAKFRNKRREPEN